MFLKMRDGKKKVFLGINKSQSYTEVGQAKLKEGITVQLEARLAGWPASGSGYITLMDCRS